MMFISEDPVQHVVRTEIPAVHDTAGRMISPKQRRIVIQFQRGHAPMWVRELAVRTFEFRKRPEEIPVETWVSWYDSAEDQKARGWTDEERKAIEEYLVGAFATLHVEQPRVAKPWPTVDRLTVVGRRTAEDVAEKMASVAEEIGVPLGDVTAYVRDNLGSHGWQQPLLDLLAEKEVQPEQAEDAGEIVAA